MKKFFTSVPFQKQGIKEYIYKPVGNANLTYDQPHSLPILNAINNFADNGEEIQIVFLAAENDDIKRNITAVMPTVD